MIIILKDIMHERTNRKKHAAISHVHPKGKEVGVTMSPIAEIFAKKVRIIKALQNAEYEAEEYKTFRKSLVECQ